MDTAKVFESGRGQAVLLPERFRFNTDEVVIRQLGSAAILAPKEFVWQTFLSGLNEFTDDIFENGREQGGQQERGVLSSGERQI